MQRESISPFFFSSLLLPDISQFVYIYISCIYPNRVIILFVVDFDNSNRVCARQQYYKYIIKFDKDQSIMLIRPKQIVESKKKELCDCNFWEKHKDKIEEGNIFVNNFKEVSQHIKAADYNTEQRTPKLQKSKYSLKIIRPGKENTNITGTNTPNECVKTVQTTLQTSLLIRTDSQTITAFKDAKHRRNNTGSTQYFLTRPPQQESFQEFRRYNIGEIFDAEIVPKHKKDIFVFQNSAIEQQQIHRREVKHKYNSSRPFVQIIHNNSKPNHHKNRSFSTYNLELPNFYSEQQLKNESIKTINYNDQVSSIVFKKRTTKHFHHIDELKFKDTESVCDEESQQISKVISNGYTDSSFGNISECVFQNHKRLKDLLRPKYSKIEEFEHA